MKTSEVLRNPGKILYNRYVMYFILLLAIANLLFLAVGGELMMVATFFMVGFITSFFSKNMIVIMTIAMAITNIVRFGTGQRMEGLENEEEGMEDEKETEGMEDENEGMEDENEGMEDETEGMEDEAEGMEDETEGMTDDKKIKLANSIKKIENYAPLVKNFHEMMEGFNELAK
jgi:hypothetical protein